MSVDIEGLGVKLEAVSGPQRLPAKNLTECERCHSRVNFRARSSTASTDPRFKVEYLYCPVCGATATRVSEVEVLLKPVRRKSKVRYRYEA